MITLDTSAVLALANRADADHKRLKQILQKDRGPFLIPAGILAEVCYFLEARFKPQALDSFLESLEQSAFILDCGEQDFARIRELTRRYQDLPLGYADAAVITCAERTGKKVMTLDFRHFSVVEKEGMIEVVPQR